MIKKPLQVLLCLCFCVGMLSLTSCQKAPEPKKKTITNTVEITEIEADMTVYQWLHSEPAPFVEIPLKDIAKLIDEGGSGLIYIGYMTCEWCKRAIPELNEVLHDYEFTTYYVDAHSTNFTVEPEDLELVIEKLDEVFSHDEEGNAEFFVPLVVGIKNGKITGSYTSLVPEFEYTDINDSLQQMSDEEKLLQQEKYREIIEKTLDD